MLKMKRKKILRCCVTYSIRLATELMEPELRRTLWSLTAFAKMKRQVLLCEPPAASPRDFKPDSLFHVNQDFALV